MKIRILFLLLSVTFFVNCDEGDKKEAIIYPIDIETTDYFLPTGCSWQYPLTAVPDSVCVISSIDDLYPLTTCALNEISVDFETYSLLYSRGGDSRRVITVTTGLQQISDNEYSLNADIPTIPALPGFWTLSVKIPKLPQNAVVRLNKNQYPSELPPLKNTNWKLAGIVNEQTGVLIELEPKDCENCYTFNFNTDSTAWGHSTGNAVWVDFLRKENFTGIATLAGERGDGYLFRYALLSATSYSYEKVTSPTIEGDYDYLLKFFYETDGIRYYLKYFKLDN